MVNRNKTHLLYFAPLFYFLEEEMAKAKKEEEKIDGLWVMMLLAFLFHEPPKQPKIINIYMGDDE